MNRIWLKIVSYFFPPRVYRPVSLGGYPLHYPMPVDRTVDLLDDGVLWLINRVAFHPRGFTLAWDPDERKFSILGDGTEAYVFEEETDDAKFKAVEALFARASA